MHATDYLAQSHWHDFRYRVGEMIGLDRERRLVHVAPVVDDEGADRHRRPTRRGYDTLVIAVGSQTNDFGTPGVAEHAIALETPAAGRSASTAGWSTPACARTCRRRRCRRASCRWPSSAPAPPAWSSRPSCTRPRARWSRTTSSASTPSATSGINLIEAGPRILPALPERIAASAHRAAAGLGVRVRTGARVTEVSAEGVQLAGGELVPAELVVWAAGVKAPDFLRELAGLETNRINQLVVRPTLQTTRDDDIFALGDCGAAPWLGHEGERAAARAGRAPAGLAPGQADPAAACAASRSSPGRYRDFGSLVSLGEYSTVGNLMGALVGGNLWVEGLFARMMYLSLYKMHQVALHGWWKTALGSASRWLTRSTEPRVKLH